MSGIFKTDSLEFIVDGTLHGKGYSGHGEGLNNWKMEMIANIGPIPRGRYEVSEPFKHPTKGPICFRLTPVGHDAHGRSGFLIHGDNAKGDHSASEGCLILDKTIRQFIADYHLKVLEVT